MTTSTVPALLTVGWVLTAVSLAAYVILLLCS
jgi:hypothetical protein